ncbi:MAG: carbon starvation protein A [Spirochaetales bacterium]|uniref:Carbon starvation protein A n=1 Tax=Candidatus Thalassospirochaeta sargassi TaxID=3119039 RepID=A0AAJ1MNU8_9SPIO|nr:carbon starvation protein A [Spirochaetales bacterium]
MDAILIMVVAFVGYVVAYQLYGRFVGKKIFNLSNDNTTPSVDMEDGVDYVPTKKGIIFGHHFTSIAGTGPIVGPAIGIIWGWIPALIWVLVGTIVMGAVHDFGSLVISLRNQGKSISEVTAKYINPRTRTIFFILVLLELWIVIAVFGLVIAIIFNMYPQSVFPVWCEIPISIILGYALYKKGAKVGIATTVAVVAMYVTVILGHFLPLSMPAIAGIPATGVWSIILLVYAFIASTLPVTTLLQPRDFINSWQLLIAMALLVIGVFASAFGGALNVVAPAVQMVPEGAPPMWPMLFITIACGAISGFHSLVSSGTSAKQVHYEEDALFVGYGSMVMEGALATLVIIAVAAGIGIAYNGPDGVVLTGTAAWTQHYSSWAAAAGLGSKIGAFVEGAANMISFVGVPKAIGIVIMGVFVASFAGTTLDTATRIQRYVIQELGSDVKASFLQGKYTATAVAVITAGILAFATGPTGTGALKLWPLFGATNQALAGLALLTITMYLKQNGGVKFLVGLIPAVFMVVMTLWGLIYNEVTFISAGNALLYIVNAIVILIVVWMTIETFAKWFSKNQAIEATA